MLPFRPTLGVIEWLDNTETLREFLTSACAEFPQQCAKAQNLFQKQLPRHKERSAGGPAQLFSSYLRRAPREAVVDDLRKRQALLRDELGRPCRTLLQQAVVRLSAGPEALLRLRTRMAESHALLSAADWLSAAGARAGAVTTDSPAGRPVRAAGCRRPHAPHPAAGGAPPAPPAGRRSAGLRARAGRGPQSAEHARRCVRQTRGRLRGAHPAADVCQLLADAAHLSAEEVAAWSAAARGLPDHKRHAALPGLS